MPTGEHLRGKGGKKFGHGANDQDPTKGGRKLKIYTIIKELGYGQDDIRAAFGEIAFYNDEDIDKIIKDKKAPAITKIIAKAMKNAIKSGKYHEVKDILEQLIGRAKETKEINGNLLGATVVIKSEGEDPEVL